MAGRGSTQPSIKITPNRETHIVYDCNDISMVNRGFGLIRSAEDLKNSSAAFDGCVYLPGVGIRLDEDFAATRAAYFSDSDYGIYARPGEGATGAADAEVADGYVKKVGWRTKTELTNAYSGSVVPSTGHITYKKKAAAGSDFSSDTFKLAGDQAAFVGPVIAQNEVYMDRVMRSFDVHNYDQDVVFTIMQYGDTGQQGGPVGVCYFSGPAGYTDDFFGYGQYAAAVYASGVVDLYERGYDQPTSSGDTWTLRSSMRFPIGSLFKGNQGYVLRVSPVPEASVNPMYPSGSIFFRLSEWTAQVSPNGTGGLIDALAGLASQAINTSANCYNVPWKERGVVHPTIEAPIRLDLPRPFFCEFQVKQVLLKSSGTIRDYQFHVTQGDFLAYDDGVGLAGHTMVIEWYYETKHGPTCTVNMDLYDGFSETPLTPDRTGIIGSVTEPAGEYAEYDFDPTYVNLFGFRIDLGLVGDLVHNVTFKSIRMRKTAQFTDIVGSLVEGGHNRDLSILGAGSDPTVESAGWKVKDVNRTLDILQYSASLGVKINTKFDVAGTDRVVLFQGYIEAPEATRRKKQTGTGRFSAGTPQTYPISWDYDVRAVGMWQRLLEARDTTLFSFVQSPDEANGVPYKVSTILTTILKRCGFSGELVQIAENPIRLWPTLSTSANAYVVKPLADLAQALSYYARDYLGAALIWDPNYGDDGAWTLVYPPRAPYTNVAYFTTATPSVSNTIFSLNSYLDVEMVDGDIASGGLEPDGVTVKNIAHLEATVKQIPVVELRATAKRPICNRLTITGVGLLNSWPPKQLVTTFVNPNSYKFRGDSVAEAGENNFDWLGREVPFWYLDPTLCTEAAIAAVGARLYEILCFGYKLFKVHSPLQFIDRDYGGSVGVRKSLLRFGDPVVLYDGENEWQCIVRSVSIDIRKDSMQMMNVELQQVRF